jgi:uncharacterized protein YPO0396
MSDTPRTDAEAFLPHDSKYRVCDADFARQLERELNAANDYNREIRERNEWLNDKIDAANDRIKRLEEAGDAMVDDSEFIGNHDKILAWREAKEAKP